MKKLIFLTLIFLVADDLFPQIKITASGDVNSYFQLTKSETDSLGMKDTEQNYVLGGLTLNILDQCEEYGIFGKGIFFQDPKYNNEFSSIIGAGFTYRHQRFVGISVGLAFHNNAKKINPDAQSVAGIVKLNANHSLIPNKLEIFLNIEGAGNKRLIYSTANVGLEVLKFLSLSATWFKYGQESAKIGGLMEFTKEFDYIAVSVFGGVSWEVQGNQQNPNKTFFNAGARIGFFSFK